MNTKTNSRGVDKFFQTLTRLVSRKEFSLAKSENISGLGEKGSVRVKNKYSPG
jgi:hypothetical protein